MKKFSKLLAVLVALAVIICPMTSAIVANATGTGSYSIVAEDANNVVLTISSTDGFLVYLADVTFNEASAFQSAYSSDGYTNGLKVIDYTLKTGSKDAYNLPAISANYSGSTLSLLVSATDAGTIELYTEVQIGIRVASGSTANLAKIQAADEGDVTTDPSLLGFGSKVNATTGAVDLTNNDNATTGVAHTHNYTKATPYEVSAPTCTALGVYRKTCETCGAVDSSATYYGSVYADHNPSVVNNTADNKKSDATCTEAAVYYYECSVCGQAVTELMQGFVSTRTVGEALGHNMTDHPAVTPTCTTGGNTQYYSCDRCGKFFSDAAGNTEIAANSWNLSTTAHTPVTDAAVAATCTSTGLTEGSHCSVCLAVLTAQTETPIDPTNHTNIVEDAAVAPTCVATGKTAGSHCAACDTVIVAQETVAATGVHTWGEYVSDGNATCAADGTKTATCTVCGVATNTVTDTGSATGLHTVVNDPAVAATCTATGLTAGSHCSVCNTVLTAQTETPIDPTNHTAVVEDAAVAATCTATGLTAGSHCTACDTVIVAQETVNALGHDYTYTDHGDGTHDIGCTRCDYAANEACVDANEDGYCDLCNAQLACEHNYVGVVTTQPTKNATGVMTYTCSLCGDSYTEPIAIPTKIVTALTVESCDLCIDEAVYPRISVTNANLFSASGSDSYFVVIDYDKYASTDLVKYAKSTETVTFDMSEKTGQNKNGSKWYFAFHDIPLYGMGNQFQVTIYTLTDGVVTKYWESAPTCIAALAEASYGLSSTLDQCLADLVQYGNELQAYFANQNEGSDLAAAPLLGEYFSHLDDASLLTSANIPYTSVNESEAITDTNIKLVGSTNVIIADRNQIRYRVSVPLAYDTANLRAVVHYNNGYGDPVSVTYTTANMRFFRTTATANEYYIYFTSCALYDLEKSVTIDVYYDDVLQYTNAYTLGTYVNANADVAQIGVVVKAMGVFYESLKAQLFATKPYITD